ncbi:hypothetical protein [Paludisphaera rhizosphaerae]|uniref:hypothetical protein n=1 Tax=Paludisphaera rhizosphaerae TaxID=2711216 RepID=UPI0013EBE979|nr:hypothetical protein [Paludisphaera rhizosphaerae]
MNRKVVRWAASSLASACLLALVGCGEPHYEHAKVHGKVTYKGKPVTTGSVLFVPTKPMADGSLLPASGELNAEGTYELTSGGEPGAVIGEHKVVIMAVDPGATAEAAPDVSKVEIIGPSPSGGPPKGGSKVPKFKSLVPEKYGDPTSTPLVETVKSGENTIDIELTD